MSARYKSLINKISKCLSVKVGILGILMVVGLTCLTGCGDLLGSGESESALSRRGIQYYFDEKIYNTVVIEMLDNIRFNAPSMEGIVKDNTRVYSGENTALVLWIEKSKKDIGTDKIINKYAEKMVDNIEEVADIDDVGVEFDLQHLAEDKVNNIVREKYVGSIEAIGKDGIDVELKTVVYTFKIGGRPGYIMGVVTNRAQEKEEFVEIETNAQIMANTIKLK